MARKLNLSKLKDKVAQLKGEKKTSNRKSIFWTPQLPKGETSAEYLVFMLPWQDLEDYPFKERWFYYSLGNMKDAEGNSMKNEQGHYIKAPLTLKQFGEQDPVDDLIRKLWDIEGKEEDEAKQDREDAKKLFSSQTAYVPVIVKGEESLGVRLWKFSSKVVYERLIELFMKDRIGDLNDPTNDIWLTVKVVEEPKKPFPLNKKIGSIDLELLDRAPLSDDKEQIEGWLGSIPDLDEALKYQRYDHDGLRKLLFMWADSGAAESALATSGTGTEGGAKGAKKEDKEDEDKPKKRGRSSKKKVEEEPKNREEALKELSEFMDDDDDDDDE